MEFICQRENRDEEEERKEEEEVYYLIFRMTGVCVCAWVAD